MTNTPGSSANNLAGPTHVTIDPVTGMVFVADSSNHRVLRYRQPADAQDPPPPRWSSARRRSTASGRATD